MSHDVRRRVLILNADAADAPAIARLYAAAGWAITLEPVRDAAALNDLVAEIWDGGGHVRVLPATAVVPDVRLGRADLLLYDHVLDARAPCQTTRALASGR